MFRGCDLRRRHVARVFACSAPPDFRVSLLFPKKDEVLPMTLDRRTFLQISAAGVCAAALPLPTHAKITGTRQQVPAFYRVSVGDIEVTALNDGVIELEASLYASADKAEAEQLLKSAHRAPKIQSLRH